MKVNIQSVTRGRVLQVRKARPVWTLGTLENVNAAHGLKGKD